MPGWLTGSFLHPEYLLPGAACIAAPIIIHLINRLRYKRVRWAAMEFLLKSQQRNRRRLLLEQLLLLLARVAIVLLIVALLARPIINNDQLTWFQNQSTQHVIILDDTLSMRDSWADGSGFARATAACLEIVNDVLRRPGRQLVTVITATRPAQPLFAVRLVDPTFVGELRGRLDSLRPSNQHSDLTAAVKVAVQTLVADPTSMRVVHVVSDFRDADWRTGGVMGTTLQEFAATGTACHLVRSVPETHENLAVVDLSAQANTAAAGVPVRLSATVENSGSKPASDVRLSILINGEKLPNTVTIEKIEPLAEVVREFDVVFPKSGWSVVQVQLPSDSLEPDNSRNLSINIPDSNPVLIVDGDPARSDATYLADALAPAPGLTGLSPTLEATTTFGRTPLDRYSSIHMVNVGEFPREKLRALEEFVANGGGLAWYLGDQVRPTTYNATLYASGKGLFPAPLKGTAALSPDETNPTPDMRTSDHPLFRVFTGEDNPFIDLVRVNQYFEVDSDWVRPDSVREIGSLRNRAPLFFEHRFGKGKVISYLSGIGQPWSNWPQNPSFVVLALELQRSIARSDRTPEQHLAGATIAVELDPALYSPELAFTLPDGSIERAAATPRQRAGAVTAPNPADAQAAAIVEGVPVLSYEFKNTSAAGVYSLQTQTHGGEKIDRRWAVNTDPQESRLQLATDDALRGLFPRDLRVTIHESGPLNGPRGERNSQDLHELVLLILIAILMGEQLMAWKFSHHLTSSGAAA